MNIRASAFLLVAITMASLATSGASAQILGTLRWRTEPYCNVLNLTVTQNGGVFTLDGFDEPCGGSPRLPVHGVAVPQADGSVTLGLNVISLPGGAPINLEAAISPATVAGTWRDSAGGSGTLSFNPASASGSPRPMIGAATTWGHVNGYGTYFLGKSANVASVTRLSSVGEWCIKFTQPIPLDRRMGAVVSPASGITAGVVANQTAGEINSCPGGLWISAYTDVRITTPADATFTFIVP